MILSVQKLRTKEKMDILVGNTNKEKNGKKGEISFTRTPKSYRGYNTHIQSRLFLYVVAQKYAFLLCIGGFVW
jgi:hypothetical protein